ncbi:MAG: hypothetical protein RLZZ399_2414 [Verrucomicrobiota bacterium]|jgi:uncharacterized protein YicC (UPF0701 family)
MERPTPDLWQDYLEALELLEELRRRRAAFSETVAEEALGQESWCVEEAQHEPDALENPDSEGRLLDWLDVQIRRGEVLKERYEKRFDEMLHGCAHREEEGRRLFLMVSQMVREVNRVMEEVSEPVEEAVWEDWARLLGEYEALREVWQARLPKEDWDASG